MHSFYIPTISNDTENLLLSEEESKHACRVLRLKIGDKITILDGQGHTFLAEIKEDNPKKCLVQILNVEREDNPEKELHIAIAPTKNNDRIEWFLEKSTEIGITEITFLLCENSERKHIKLDRCEKILIASMKQSKRKFLPKLNQLISFEQFVEKFDNGAIAHCYDNEKVELKTVFQHKNYPILIGPEGDFSSSELALAKAKNYAAISLGNNRLRTETAGIVACVEAMMI